MPGSDGVVSIAVVCEGPSDLPVICDISDRVIAERLGLTDPSSVISRREFRGAKPGRPFLAWADVKSIAKEMRIRFHGHFDNAGVRDPAKEDAQTSRKALRILKAVTKRPAAVILVRDSDGSTERRKGMTQARDEGGYEFEIVIGVAHLKRECWVLCGFDPVDDIERELHAELRQELGFDPCLHPHELTAKHDADKKSAKRVLSKLTQHDRDRERVCWNDAELTVLRARGDKNGLTAFFDEIEDRLTPLFLENQGQN